MLERRELRGDGSASMPARRVSIDVVRSCAGRA